MAYVMDSPAQPVEDLGVTRLADTCEHLFCRKELSTLMLILCTLHTASHNALFNSLLAWIRDRVRIKCACTSKFADLQHCISMQNITCPICRTRLIKSTLDSASVNAARRRILRAWRSERQILNGDQLRSIHSGYS